VKQTIKTSSTTIQHKHQLFITAATIFRGEYLKCSSCKLCIFLFQSWPPVGWS